LRDIREAEIGIHPQTVEIECGKAVETKISRNHRCVSAETFRLEEKTPRHVNFATGFKGLDSGVPEQLTAETPIAPRLSIS
jgi:hypothetical protein